MTSPADGRGGSTPPRPVSGGGPQQWFVLRPWLFDVTATIDLLRRDPRPRPAAPRHGLGTRLQHDPQPRQQPAVGPAAGRCARYLLLRPQSGGAAP